MEPKCNAPLVGRPRSGLSVIMIACCLACTSPSVLAGPPFVTDDPEPVNYHYSEFYIGAQQTKSTGGRSGTLPHIEYNYGAAPDVQLHMTIPYAFNNPASGTTERGIGDTEFGVKYRFIQETENSPMVGAFPILLTHTGNSNKGLGAGSAQLFLPLWIQKKWGAWQSYGGGGYWVSHTTDIKNHWFAGWQVQKEISEHISLGGEIFHNTEQVTGQESSTGFNIGGDYNFDGHNHLLFSAGKGLRNATLTNQSSTYLAYQRKW
jgi:hypothetical protein